MKNKIIYIILSLLLSGCASHIHQKYLDFIVQDIDISGNIVDQEKLLLGGKLAFTDLKAGPLAIADEQTDRVSLKIIQGATDALQNNAIGIAITNDPHVANLIFEGYIEEFSQPGKFSKMVLFKNRSRISVSGEIYERKTGLRVLSFASSKVFKSSKETSLQAALSIGQTIGEFIKKHATREDGH